MTDTKKTKKARPLLYDIATAKPGDKLIVAGRLYTDSRPFLSPNLRGELV